MSQELEEIKNRRKKHDMDILPVWAEDIDWLIEQTERVQELERKIERYRKVLAFYADKDNYRDMPLFDDETMYDEDGLMANEQEYAPPAIYYDNGEKARQALESDN